MAKQKKSVEEKLDFEDGTDEFYEEKDGLERLYDIDEGEEENLDRLLQKAMKKIRDGEEAMISENLTGESLVALAQSCKREGKYAAAKRFAALAVEKGEAEGYVILGDIYNQGYGVSKDFKKALDYYLAGAEAGDPYCQAQAGASYSDGGKGAVQNFSKANFWFLKAAEQGDPIAMLGLAKYAQNVKRDSIEAYMWLNLSSARGLDSARKFRDRISSTMYSGDVMKGQEKTRKWLEKHESGFTVAYSYSDWDDKTSKMIDEGEPQWKQERHEAAEQATSTLKWIGLGAAALLGIAMIG